MTTNNYTRNLGATLFAVMVLLLAARWTALDIITTAAEQDRLLVRCIAAEVRGTFLKRTEPAIADVYIDNRVLTPEQIEHARTNGWERKQ